MGQIVNCKCYAGAILVDVNNRTNVLNTITGCHPLWAYQPGKATPVSGRPAALTPIAPIPIMTVRCSLHRNPSLKVASVG